MWSVLELGRGGGVRRGGGGGSRKWAKHAWLYSDLLQVFQRENNCQLLVLGRGGLNFCVRRTAPLRVGKAEEVVKPRSELSQRMAVTALLGESGSHICLLRATS